MLPKAKVGIHFRASGPYDDLLSLTELLSNTVPIFGRSLAHFKEKNNPGIAVSINVWRTSTMFQT